MAVTPFIRPIQTRKGIFYGFQSALEDLTLTFNNNTTSKSRFSHFVALRIPEIGTPDTLETDNKLQFGAQGESALIEGINADQNVNLAQSFQSYALNLEALLVSRPEYKREEKLTVAERVFWKWLKEFGALRFREANNLERNLDALGTTLRYVEETETDSTYKRVVQYVGEIDVVNNRRNKDNSYIEIYCHIPTNVGNTPYVLFDSFADDNYKENMTITHDPDDPLNIEYLSGRRFDDVHPFGLSVNAYYDLDDGSIQTSVTDEITNPGSLSPGRWFNKTINNSYYTDEVFGDAGNLRIEKTNGPVTIEYLRSNLDGIMIDFNLDNYRLASENPEIRSFNQFNDYVANKDFEYNAILIYYDVFDPNNLDADGNPIDIETNLYGILFLNKIEQSGLEFQIPTTAKYKPNPLDKINGNAFAYKANIKIDNSVENVFVEKSINDFSTFSLDLFVDVLSEFRDIQQQYNDKIVELEQLRQEVEGVKDLLINSEDQSEIKLRLNNIENSLEANQAIFDNTDSFNQLIESISDRVNDIVEGNTPLEISYNLDLVRSGDGIFVDRSVPNRISINNTTQNFNISNDSITNVFENQFLPLSKFTNYYRHEADDSIVLVKDHEIFIDDTKVKWAKGQTLRLVFEDEFIPDIYDIKIYTDAAGLTGNGEYGKLIAILNDTDFTPSDNKPIFDIVCVNQNPLTFKVDKIR